jgi:hypothetical protein
VRERDLPLVADFEVEEAVAHDAASRHALDRFDGQQRVRASRLAMAAEVVMARRDE